MSLNISSDSISKQAENMCKTKPEIEILELAVNFVELKVL
jgi:hypothetical protein